MGGVTGAGLFGKLRRPGAPTEFMDSRTVEDYLASGEFEETLQRFGYEVPAKEKPTNHEVAIRPQVYRATVLTCSRKWSSLTSRLSG
jgi:hypothetical protein